MKVLLLLSILLPFNATAIDLQIPFYMEYKTDDVKVKWRFNRFEVKTEEMKFKLKLSKSKVKANFKIRF